MKKYALYGVILGLLAVYTSSNAMQGGLTKARYAAAAVTRAFSTQVVQQPTVPFFSLADAARVQENYYAKLKTLPWAKLATYHIDAFKTEQNQLTKKFLETVSCTQKEWEENVQFADALLKREHHSPRALHLKGTHITGDRRTMIDSVARACCIEPQLLYTIESNRLHQDNQHMYAHANAHEGGYAHELIHVSHKDTTHTRARNLCDQNNFIQETEKPQACDIEWNFFKEIRADILGSLANPNYAYQNYLYFTAQPKHSRLSHTHPLSSERARYCKELYDEMVKAG